MFLKLAPFRVLEHTLFHSISSPRSSKTSDAEVTSDLQNVDEYNRMTFIRKCQTAERPAGMVTARCFCGQAPNTRLELVQEPNPTAKLAEERSAGGARERLREGGSQRLSMRHAERPSPKHCSKRVRPRSCPSSCPMRPPRNTPFRKMSEKTVLLENPCFYKVLFGQLLGSLFLNSFSEGISGAPGVFGKPVVSVRVIGHVRFGATLQQHSPLVQTVPRQLEHIFFFKKVPRELKKKTTTCSNGAAETRTKTTLHLNFSR